MRAVLIAAVAAIGIGIAGSSAGVAAPVYGDAIHNAANLDRGIEQVHWRWHHHHHWWWWHHHRHHRWWW